MDDDTQMSPTPGEGGGAPDDQQKKWPAGGEGTGMPAEGGETPAEGDKPAQ